MIEKLLELDDIYLIPAELNAGDQSGKYNYGVTDPLTGEASLPIWTSANDAVCNTSNWKVWKEAGINPVLPITELIKDRLEGCQFLFTAFTMQELKQNFIDSGKRQSPNQFKIYIEVNNGHDTNLLNLIVLLKKTYGRQINIMAGPIGNSKTYIDYCKAGVDYVRVGLGTGSLVDRDKYGFYYPLGSLLIDIAGVKATAVGLNHPKIVADGGIADTTDIIKAIALGADYVMCGRQFVRLLEASGQIYQKVKNDGKHETLEEIPKGALGALSIEELRERGAQRYYCGNTTFNQIKKGYIDAKCDWIKVNSTLTEWIDDFIAKASNAFTLGNAVTWEQFKNNISYGRIA